MYVINLFAVSLCLLYSLYYFLLGKTMNECYKRRSDNILKWVFLVAALWQLGSTLRPFGPGFFVAADICGMIMAVVASAGFIKLISKK